MKKIVNTAVPVVFATTRTPLSTTLSIIQEGENGGPLTQAQDVPHDLWIPNRRLHPLFLRPHFEATDPDTGETVTSGYEQKWYLVNNGEYTEITSVTTSDDYYKECDAEGNLTGRLVVRKNVNYDAPVTIACRVTCPDNLRKQAYTEEELVLLTAENKPEAFYSVKIQAPSTLTFNPIWQKRDTPLAGGALQYGSMFRLSAKAALGEEDATTGVVFFWYAGDTLIGETLECLFYRDANQLAGKGQGTDTIVVDMDFADQLDIAVAIGYYEAVYSPTGNPHAKGYYEQADGAYVLTADTTVNTGKQYYTKPTAPNTPARDHIAAVWQWPNIDALPYSKGGTVVREGKTLAGTKDFAAIVQADGLDVGGDVVDEYVRLEWKRHGMNSAEVTVVGWGREVSISNADLYRTGYENVEVYPDIWLLGCYKLVVDGEGKYVTSDGRYVVSRW